MDEGITWNFKQNYRRLLIEKPIDSYDYKTQLAVDVYKAILIIQKAWRLVTQTCIRNCFKRGGFVEQTDEDTHDSDDDDDEIPLQQLRNNWNSSLAPQMFLTQSTSMPTQVLTTMR